MESSCFLTLQTPEKTLLSGEVAWVRLQTETGFIEMYPQHATFVGTILSSKITVTLPNKNQETFLVRDGFVTCINEKNRIQISVLWGEVAEKVDTKTIQEYFAFMKEELTRGGATLRPYQLRYVEQQNRSSQQLIDIIEQA